MKICYHCMQQIPNDKAHICPQCGQNLTAARQADRFLEPGTVLSGKYIVGYPLGAGGFGNTYIGWDNILCRKVAVKEFYPEQYCARGRDGRTIAVTDPKLEPRFHRGLREFLEEARRVAALHEVQGVVEISDFFEENGTGYIVMEYLEGMDIKTILDKSGSKRDYEWSRRAILAVLYTLKEVHKRGVIHRDIAPDNIFVTKEGIIKLIDFGAAKYASAENTSDIMLKAGYAPIEQYGRKMEQGPYTDLYAAAALFYRMLTGQKPIPANERKKQDGLIPPSEMGILIPEQAELAIMVCLNIMPQYRLQSAEDFMEALDGKYFIPIYEPEWILPPMEERKGFFGKLASLPVPAKAAVCAACICIIGAAAFGAAAVINHAGTAAGLKETGKSGTFTMEDYSGQAYEDVAAGLEEIGFQNVDAPEYVLDSKPEGTILRQNIDPLAAVSGDDRICFTVSGGDRYYTIPDFTGMEEKEIIRYFTEKNFDVAVHENPCDNQKDVHTETGENDSLAKKEGNVVVKRCFSKDAEEGICVEQSLEAGEKCDVDTKVKLMISVGGEFEDFNVSVPDFTGMKREKADALLNSSGLLDIVEAELVYPEENQDAAEAFVEKQSLAAGDTVNFYQDKGMKFRLEFAMPQPKPKKTAPDPDPNQQAPQNPEELPAEGDGGGPAPQEQPQIPQADPPDIYPARSVGGE